MEHPTAWTESLAYLPDSSAKAHCEIDAQGRAIAPKPHRANLHLNIIKDSTQNTSATAQGAPKALLVIGAPGSGRSALMNTLENFVIINPDRIKEKLPEYQEATKKRAKNAALIVHAESSLIAKQIQVHAVSQRMNLAIELTGDNPEAIKTAMQSLKKHGYEVGVALCHCPAKDHLRRTISMSEITGRWLSEDFIQQSNRQALDTFKQIRHECDRFRVIDTQNPQAPQVVWEKRPEQEIVNSQSQFVKALYVKPESATSQPRGSTSKRSSVNRATGDGR